MSGASSNKAAWSSLLDPPVAYEEPSGGRRADDPRLGELMEIWQRDPQALHPGRAVLVGFPVDEGVRRNGGRVGAAEAPREIRRWLHRLTPWDGEAGVTLGNPPLLDLGDIRAQGSLEESQQALGKVVAEVLHARAVPVILGGGHETAFGHFLGYTLAGIPVAIINVDAHLDVRPLSKEGGHSGSPFRQAREHGHRPLPGDHYVCLGAQPSQISRDHFRYVRDGGGTVFGANETRGQLVSVFQREVKRLKRKRCQVYVTVDADVVQAADVPAVSAPNPLGLAGAEVAALARAAGETPSVASFDLVEINPRLDRDAQSARWAAVTIWYFLAGIVKRSPSPP
jgi:formiminoglutamase